MSIPIQVKPNLCQPKDILSKFHCSAWFLKQCWVPAITSTKNAKSSELSQLSACVCLVYNQTSASFTTSKLVVRVCEHPKCIRFPSPTAVEIVANIQRVYAFLHQEHNCEHPTCIRFPSPTAVEIIANIQSVYAVLHQPR